MYLYTPEYNGHQGFQLDNVRRIAARRKKDVSEGSGAPKGVSGTKWEPVDFRWKSKAQQ